MMMEKLMLSPNIIGFLIIIGGLIQHIFPPKKINSLYGYRTPRSKKNIEVWNFAQKLSAKLMISVGVILCLFGCIALILGLEDQLVNTTGIVLMISLFLILLIYMELTLKKKFPKQL